VTDAIKRSRFLLVVFKWEEEPKTKELEPLFDTALDWARPAPNCWVLWTNNDPDVWLGYVRKHMSEKDNVFIAELNLSTTSKNFTGWADKWFWRWLDKHRT
jgi:hypothetical protein